MKLLFAALVVPTLLSAYAPPRAEGQPLAPDLEERAQRVGKQLRCAVCQGMSVTDSPASMARSQLEKVRELVSEGKSDEEIYAYFVARYGEWVLLEPKAKGFNWLVWLGPVFLVVFGAWVVFRVVRARTVPETATPAAAAATPQGTPGDAYLKAIQAEVDE